MITKLVVVQSKKVGVKCFLIPPASVSAAAIKHLSADLVSCCKPACRAHREALIQQNCAVLLSVSSKLHCAHRKLLNIKRRGVKHANERAEYSTTKTQDPGVKIRQGTGQQG